MNLRFVVLQRTSRDGNHNGWTRVGDVLRPLCMKHSQKDEGESGEGDLVAIESAVLELSLSPVGLLTNGLVTNGETIVQATKSARNNRLARWAGILGSVLFIGGFLVKSYVEAVYTDVIEGYTIATIKLFGWFFFGSFLIAKGAILNGLNEGRSFSGPSLTETVTGVLQDGGPVNYTLPFLQPLGVEVRLLADGCQEIGHSSQGLLKDCFFLAP